MAPTFTATAQGLSKLFPTIVERELPCIPKHLQQIDWQLPLHSWDTHVHVFNPAAYPYAPSHAYSPVEALYPTLLGFNGNLTVDHKPHNLVLVQPSPYGTDNSLILDLLRSHKASGEDRQLRAISVIESEEITDEELEEMNDLGVRGIRINAEADPNSPLDANELLRQAIQKGADRIAKHDDWTCQIFVSSDSWDHIEETVESLPVRVIADHQGGMKGTSALPNGTTDVSTQKGLKALLRLARSGKVFVKISGFYRSSKLTSGGYDDMESLIKLFATEIPDQLIWASDWPHTGSSATRSEATKDVPEPFRPVDDEAVLKNIRRWVGPELWWRMTVATPGKLFK